MVKNYLKTQKERRPTILIDIYNFYPTKLNLEKLTFTIFFCFGIDLNFLVLSLLLLEDCPDQMERVLSHHQVVVDQIGEKNPRDFGRVGNVVSGQQGQHGDLKKKKKVWSGQIYTKSLTLRRKVWSGHMQKWFDITAKKTMDNSMN